MNSDQLEGNWKEMKGKVKEKWGKLTDDDLTTINGKKDQLVGHIQKHYGIAKEEAEKQVKEYEGSHRPKFPDKEMPMVEPGKTQTTGTR
ncbi:MAG TPA: CsbD family protein [Bryobacteraceae bacterium]|jgi:uncharacterized protein YjbJ (UPF0337 family)|nr:CsbD family protein [Bryobacteraceae bacterium]